MYRVEIMMRFEQNQPAKNILYPRVKNYSIGNDGFFHLAYEANGKTYHRGISVANIITYTVTLSRNLEEPCDDGANN